ncbi:hypothetical protein [Pseudostreptobacillus hongkongensis]|uniref:hypothetical protein n=1 Tax=Pseudostreptobacillus hongkongensis TaxID=1162717 RepID=UPI000A8CBD89|nr:hypothetical protein [Pseudostreptobacillus hongkongensis]
MKYLKKLLSSVKDIIIFGNGKEKYSKYPMNFIKNDKEMIKGNISKINIDISKWGLQL